MYLPAWLLAIGCFGFSTRVRAASNFQADKQNILHQEQARPAPGQLDDFQVYAPVATPQGSSNQYGCIYTAVLMEYDFANSYGSPYVGKYTPPPCSFNRVTMNLTVTSQGRQFDRLAIMYLGDIEVFRTSTAEPTKNGIIWNYVKEMQMYNSLWREPQTIIYDEGNIVNNIYTGLFNTTLTATFFTVPESPATADLILPISARQSKSGKGSVFSLPDQNASVAYTLPRNINRAVISLSATGQIDEEFWYSNAPTSRVDTFSNTTGTLNGGGTFREVQLFIDGQLSGVSWPFPVIFTGGIVPGLWRPIVGIDAFDLHQHEIDITPWLGHLLDGKPHTFSINVASVTDEAEDQAILADTPSYWLVSGTIFLFQDSAGSVTNGTYPTVDTPAIGLSVTSSVAQDSSGQNETLIYSTRARRSISISSQITTARGTFNASWSQTLSYSNDNYLTSYGLVQLTTQSITGYDVALGSLQTDSSAFAHFYRYPLNVNSSYMISADGSSLMLEAALSNEKSLQTLGNPIFPSGVQNFDINDYEGSAIVSLQQGPVRQSPLLPAKGDSMVRHVSIQGTSLETRQIASASYYSSPNSSYSFGTTEQKFNLLGLQINAHGGEFELYKRHVKAVNTSIAYNRETLLGRAWSAPSNSVVRSSSIGQETSGRIVAGVRRMLGRGPRKSP